MNIERDKYYRTRDGRKARVIYTDAEGHYPVIAISYAHIYRLRENGRTGIVESGLDLISPWIEKPTIDRSILPAWSNKAVAMDKYGRWFCYRETPFVEDDNWEYDVRGEVTCIPHQYAPKWEGDWKDSLIVFKD